jgi:hypothetical protein
MKRFVIAGKAREVFALIAALAKLEKLGIIKLGKN